MAANLTVMLIKHYNGCLLSARLVIGEDLKGDTLIRSIFVWFSLEGISIRSYAL